jgi:hypothetical protein
MMATPVGLKQHCAVNDLRSCTCVNGAIDPAREYFEAPAPMEAMNASRVV